MTTRSQAARLAALTAISLGSLIVLVDQHPASSTPPGNCPQRRTEKPWTTVPPECPPPVTPVDPCDDDNEPADNPQGCQPDGPANPEPEPTVPCANPTGANDNICPEPEPRPPAVDPTPTVPERTDTEIGTAAVLDAPAAVAVVASPELAG